MPAEKVGAFGYWRDPVFLFSLAVYALNREVIKPRLHTYSPFFHGHLDDCLLVPVALPVFLLVYRRLGLRPDDAPPRWWEIALHVAVWSLFYKWFGPFVLHHGAADLFDVACFAGGGVVAWLLWCMGWKWSVNVPTRTPRRVIRRR
ncbi:MAG: hypothetical protein LV481_15130 [Methylacidiphilales bacterium]|nr:hypothetical protein [Candidatus Methylacidiphilales bacterium]